MALRRIARGFGLLSRGKVAPRASAAWLADEAPRVAAVELDDASMYGPPVAAQPRPAPQPVPVDDERRTPSDSRFGELVPGIEGVPIGRPW